MFETNTTYDWDLKLFKELGLKPFSCGLRTETFVGEVKTDEYSVKIWVDCYPAQFYRAEILCSNGTTVNISTGSGSFGDYWSIFEKIASGMVAIKSLTIR